MEYHRIKLAITERCNLDCIHCYMKQKSSKCMNVEIAKKLLREAHALGVEVVDLTGGEPSLHPEFPRILDSAITLGFKQINVCTNGYALDLKDFEGINLSPIHLYVSMDGVSEDVVRHIRGRSVSEIIVLFQQLRWLAIRFSLRFCINQLNRQEVSDMIALAHTMGVKADFEPTQVVGNASKDLVLTNEQMTCVASTIRNSRDHEIAIDDSFTSQFPCDGGQLDLLSINADGIATVCLMMGTDESLLYGERGLKQMWKHLIACKKRMEEFQPIMEQCKACPHLALCRSGCRATAYTNKCFNPWKEGG